MNSKILKLKRKHEQKTLNLVSQMMTLTCETLQDLRQYKQYYVTEELKKNTQYEKIFEQKLRLPKDGQYQKQNRRLQWQLIAIKNSPDHQKQTKKIVQLALSSETDSMLPLFLYLQHIIQSMYTDMNELYNNLLFIQDKQKCRINDEALKGSLNNIINRIIHSFQYLATIYKGNQSLSQPNKRFFQVLLKYLKQLLQKTNVKKAKIYFNQRKFIENFGEQLQGLCSTLSHLVQMLYIDGKTTEEVEDILEAIYSCSKNKSQSGLEQQIDYLFNLLKKYQLKTQRYQNYSYSINTYEELRTILLTLDGFGMLFGINGGDSGHMVFIRRQNSHYYCFDADEHFLDEYTLDGMILYLKIFNYHTQVSCLHSYRNKEEYQAMRQQTLNSINSILYNGKTSQTTQ